MLVFLLASGEPIARSLGQSQWLHSSARDTAGSVLLAQELADRLFIPGKAQFLNSLAARGKQLAFGPIFP